MIKKKSTFDYIKGIRCGWVINPRTRVQEPGWGHTSDYKEILLAEVCPRIENKKKRRHEEKKLIKDGSE